MIKPTPSRRKFLKNVALVSAGLVLPYPVFAIGLGEKDLDYLPYSQPKRKDVEKIVSSIDYPRTLNLHYVIPDNEFGVTGGLHLERDEAHSRVEVDFDHPKASKLITFVRDGWAYQELEHDRTNQERYNPSPFSPSIGTTMDLVEGLFLRGIPGGGEFEYHGREGKRRDLKLRLETNYSEKRVLIDGEVKGDDVLVPSFQIDCMRFEKGLIPVEFLLKYKVKGFGIFSQKVPLRAVLQV
ncbi:hypothetical protein HOD88_03260 [archaeon]|jgi:hypothetical protein|nr:hypothetical protein [archaeon]